MMAVQAEALNKQSHKTHPDSPKSGCFFALKGYEARCFFALKDIEQEIRARVKGQKILFLLLCLFFYWYFSTVLSNIPEVFADV